ncbi:MAG: EAL domain-containing protein [Microthrixaceae bacterium]|nr:EAL domain-containing protein [Microthrixaceae bacterium]
MGGRSLEQGSDWIAHDPRGQVAWERIARFRVIAAVVLIVSIVAVPALGPQRIPVILVTGAVTLGSNIVLWWYARRGGVIGLPIALLDMVLTIVFVALVPEGFIPGLILLLGASPLWVFWVGRRRALALLTIGGMAFLLMALRGELVGLTTENGWRLALAAFAFAAACSIMTTSNIAAAMSRSNHRYDALVNEISAVVWESSGLSGDPEFINSQSEAVLGLSRQDCSTSGFLASRVHPDDLDSYVDSRRIVAEGDSTEVHYRIRDREGTIRHLHETIMVSHGRDAKPSRRGVIVDETERSVAEASLRGYDDFIAGAPTAMAILRLEDLDDADSLRVVVGNPAAARLLSTSVESAVGKELQDLIPNIPVFTQRLANVVILNTSLDAPAVKIPGSDGIYSLHAVPLPDNCVGITLDDVTSAARTAESLKHQAHHDHLTGLPNRAQFNERLDIALKDRRNDDSPSSVAVLMIDLNKFKDVNDNLGHEYGDKLLIELARRLGRNIRGCDSMARLGGDEFAILIHSKEPLGTAKDIARRIEQLIGEPFLIDNHVLEIGASIGIAVSSSDCSARDILRNADNAMYKAKAFGGGTVVFGERPNDPDSQVALAADLTSAVSTDEFLVMYQPRIDLTTLSVIGVEALVRWDHPQRGRLIPEQFLDLTTASGLSNSLTRLVVTKAVNDLARLNELADEHGQAKLLLSINVADTNLLDPIFNPLLEQVTERAGVSMSQLCLDIPEVNLSRNVTEVLSAMHALRLRGIHLTLDRFGSGASPMTLLNDLPIDEVKIDKSLVSDIHGGTETLVRAMVRLGHEFGFRVSANGVENRFLADRLRLFGCDTAQGYYFAEPMHIEELAEFTLAFDSRDARTSGH